MKKQQRNSNRLVFLTPIHHLYIAYNAKYRPVPGFFVVFLSLFVILLVAGCSTERTIAIPAHAISYQHDSTNFALVRRGLNWGNANDYGSITVRKPADYKDGPITLRIFFQFISDESGTFKFIATPVAFNSGNSFETYGSIAATEISAPSSPTGLYEQIIEITAGNGWSEQPGWWYIEIQREGTFPGNVRVMGVSIDYKSVK